MSHAQPEYVYDTEAINSQLKRMLETYFRVSGDTASGLATKLGCSLELVENWRDEGPDWSLLSRFLKSFEDATGINLDRLMVIQAKLNILSMLKDIEAVAKHDVSLAWLLQRDKDLADKIDFETLTTRDEIVFEVWGICEEIGGPLTAKQIHVNSAYMRKWWSEDEDKCLPGNRDHILERILITHYSGFVQEDESYPGSDNVRFCVLAEWTLGLPVKEALGVANFSEALDAVFDGRRDDHHSIISNLTGIGVTTVKRLLEYTDCASGEGRTYLATMAQVVRYLLLKQHPDKGDDFDRAFDQFKAPKGKGKVTNHVLWKAPGAEPAPVVEPAPPEGPPAVPEEVAAPPTDVLTEEELPEKPPVSHLSIKLVEGMEQPLPELVELQFVQMLAGLSFLLARYPSLLTRLLQELDIEILKPAPIEAEAVSVSETEPQAEQDSRPIDSIIALASGKGAMDASEQQRFLLVVKALPRIMLRMCQQEPGLRTKLSGEVDQVLIAISEYLQAADDLEPMTWLEEYSRPDGIARKIVKGS